MIKVQAIKEFQFSGFAKIKDLKRKAIDKKGWILVGDIFECDKEMCDYLMGKNDYKETVVKVIEVEPKKEKE